METFNTISFIASIASLVLSIYAIWMSFKFFEKSNEASDKTIEASKGISASVERLEKLFDKLYSDTFSMMRDTVSDMRKHIWTEKGVNSNETNLDEEIEKKAQAKMSAMKEEFTQEINAMLSGQHMSTSEQISQLKKEFLVLIEQAVNRTRTLESTAREETIREYLMRFMRTMRKNQSKIAAGDIVEPALRKGFSVSDVLNELRKMKNDGLISYIGRDIMSNTEIEIL